MKLRLRPTDTTFYDLFTASAQNLVTGADLLAQMLDPGIQRLRLADQLRAVEHNGDECTHAVVKRVNSSFITPFDREDIYRLASGLDDVMDHMEEAGDLIDLYQVGDLPHECAKQVEILQLCAELTARSMPELERMHGLDDYWTEIHRLEKDGDRCYRRVLTELVSGEYEALAVIKLIRVVDCLEDAIDAFETVANIVEQIAIKES